MRKYRAIILTLLLPLALVACGKDAKREESSSTVQNAEILHTDSTLESGIEPEQETQVGSMEEQEENVMEMDRIYIQVGESMLP